MKSTFSTSWKRSSQKRKQHKYQRSLPLHLLQKAMHVHLSSDLRAKYGIRNILVRTGDRVKIMRGQYRKKEGAVERVNLKRRKVYVTGMHQLRKDGSRVLYPLEPSNLQIQVLQLDDKRRKEKLEAAKGNGQGTIQKQKTAPTHTTVAQKTMTARTKKPDNLSVEATL